MRSLRHRLNVLRSTEVGGLARDSFHVGIWQGAISIADLVQLALVTHVLGLTALGRLALVTSFVILVGQFFDVRVGTATTRFGAARLVDHDVPGLLGVFQFGYLIDALAGVLSFAIVAALAPVVGPRLVGGNGTVLILLYALTLLISTVDESSVSVLRLLDRFRLLAACSAGVEGLRIASVALALLITPNLTSVLLALIVYDLAGACVNLVAASAVFRRRFQRSLRTTGMSGFSEKRPMIRMVLQTNVVSYARIAQVQLPTLLLGALTTTTQVGYYKLGGSAAAAVGRLADPGYAAILPRLARLWASGRRDELTLLIKRSTTVAACVMAAALAAVIVLRDPILRILGGSRATEAATVLVVLAAAQAVNGALFWNTGLLFAAGRAGVVSAVALVGVLLQVGLLVPLAALFGADGAAMAFLASYVVTNVVTTAVGLRTIERLQPPARIPTAETTSAASN